MPRAALTIIAFFALALFGATAEAAKVEKLLMPGPVIEGHLKYENECSKCHKPFSKESQKKLCLDCHDKLAADVREKKGLHGRNKEIDANECRHCHPEHKGRSFDAVRFDREVFDHSETDFALKDGHLGVKCEKCHEQKKKYREAPSLCLECHKDDDVHKGKLGKKCADCHDSKSWVKARFDHEKTKFSLKGAHKDAACNRCHPNERYKETPKDCYECHRLEETHNGAYGKKCGDCHSQKEWKKAEYDHGKTKFPLKESHKKVSCAACHREDQPKGKKLETDCYSCHKNDDYHKGGYGKKCADCHTEKEWSKNRFDHDKTKFRLRNKHEKAQCAACHRGALKEEKLPLECFGCHAPNDAHNGKSGKKCEKCHNDEGWKKKVSFDHDLTKFPLIGLHAVATCVDCHLSAGYSEARKECLACHAKDDKHEKALGPKCAECHNPNGWKLWRFDHDKASKFKLAGKHKGIKCASCHREPVKKEIKISGCVSCHRDDDEHGGGFGLNCERCHNTDSFREIKVRF